MTGGSVWYEKGRTWRPARGGVGRLGKGEGARDVRPEEDDASGGGWTKSPGSATPVVTASVFEERS